mgnify:CR=1 FL=1
MEWIGVYMNFGTKVQMLRKNHGLSQEKLAIILNINRNYLSRIETSKSEPTLSVVRDIAKYFNIDVASLMNIEDITSSKDKIKQITEGCNHLLDNDLASSVSLFVKHKNLSGNMLAKSCDFEKVDSNVSSDVEVYSRSK